jgi:hypothetical protein
MDAPTREMPRYQCHKQVHALKIKELHQTPAGSWQVTPEDGSYAPLTLPEWWIRKHNPVAGGYYVVYEDGYASFSPAQAFEEGYSLIEPTTSVDHQRV